MKALRAALRPGQGHGASSTCRQAAGRSAILGPGRPFEAVDAVVAGGVDAADAVIAGLASGLASGLGFSTSLLIQ